MTKEKYVDLIVEAKHFISKIDPSSCKLTDLNDLEGMFIDFWKKEKDIVRHQIERYGNDRKLNALYWGDLSPKGSLKFVSRASVYVDTVLVEDPILRSFHLPSGFSANTIYQALSEEIHRMDELKDWINDEMVIVHSPDLEWNDNSIWSICEGDPICEDIEGLDDNDPRKAALGSARDDLIQTTLDNCNQLNAVSYTDSFSSWKSMRNVISDDEEKYRQFLKDTFYFKAIEEVPLKFLDNVPLKIARDIRKKGYMEDLRAYFRDRFYELRKATDFEDYKEILSDCGDDIENEITQHEKEWKQIKRTISYKIPLYSVIALGSFSAISTFDPGSLSVFAGGLAGSVAIDSIHELDKYRNTKRNPIHMLFQIKEKTSK